MIPITRFVALGLLTVLATACGPELVGGGEHGTVKTTMTDDPGAGGASASRSAAPAQSVGPSVLQQAIDLEGSISADVAAAIITQAGGAVGVTSGTAQGTVGIGEGDRAVLDSKLVEVDVYPAVRLTFTRVEATLSAGTGLPVTIRVDLSGGPLVVERPVEVVVRKDETTTLQLDLNGAAWIALADPGSGLVGREAFAAALAVETVE